MLTFGSRDEAESFIQDTFPVVAESETENACENCGSNTTHGIEFEIEDSDEVWFVCENGHASCP